MFPLKPFHLFLFCSTPLYSTTARTGFFFGGWGLFSLNGPFKPLDACRAKPFRAPYVFLVFGGRVATTVSYSFSFPKDVWPFFPHPPGFWLV